MHWMVLLHAAFEVEFCELSEDVQDELLAHAQLLARFGPQLGRPTVDALKGSRYMNKRVTFCVEWPGLARRICV